MDVMSREKGKKGLILKTWERCKSIGRARGTSSSTSPAGIKRFLTRKTKSWPRLEVMPGGEEEEEEAEKRIHARKWRVAPEGCFSVYVGPDRQRFVIRTEYANHPLFRMLLEEAEAEYGYNSQAPLSLPCDVDIFYRVLTAMDDDGSDVRSGCGNIKRAGSYHVLSPPSSLAVNDQFHF